MIRRWLPVLLLLALTWVLSGSSGAPLPQPFPHFDKVAHLIEYAVLGALLGRALDGRRRATLLAVVLAVLWGATDELHQSFVPGRDASVADLAADALGAMLGAASWARVAPRVTTKRRRRDAGERC